MKTNQWLKLAGLFSILLFAADMVSAQTNDSIVSFEADVAQLSLLPASDVPNTGTFWLVSSNSGITAPFPCAPPGMEDYSTYVLPNGSFLVDGTTGGNGVSGRQLVNQMNSVSNLIVQTTVQAEAQAARQQRANSMNRSATMTASGPPSFNDIDGTNDYSPDDVTYTPPDYGTNLYISQWGMISNKLIGVASNTMAVQYEYLTNSDLTTTNWGHTSMFTLGSSTTNWTLLNPFPVNSTTNLFFRLLSYQSSDSSGIPDWWETQYGLTGVNPNSLDAAGDGFSIYQKYALGVNPDTFVTPATPQNLTASYDASTTTAILSWSPSAGNVTGYTVKRIFLPYNYAPSPESISFTTTTNNYADSSASAYLGTFNSTYSGVSYQVQANYGSSGSSAWSTAVSLVPSTLIGTLAPGTNGETCLEVSGIPVNAVTIRLTAIFADYTASGDMTFATTNLDIAVSSFVNGGYVLPVGWPATPPFPNGNSWLYDLVIASVDASGNIGVGTGVGGDWGVPFYDARRQMKDNLIFQLRAAATTEPLHFELVGTNGFNDTGGYGNYSGYYDYPSNYVCAGLYPFLPSWAWPRPEAVTCDPTLPYEDNARCYNFVFSLANVDMNGDINTGIQTDFPYGYDLDLQNPPAYLFLTNGLPLPNLLSTNNSRWIYYDAFGENGQPGPMDPVDAGIVQPSSSDGDYTLAVTNNARNWFGLPYRSVLVAYSSYDYDDDIYTGPYTNVIPAGSSATFSIYENLAGLYPETAQPQFQTLRYNFYRANKDWLPGSALFTPTNDTPLQQVGYGSTATVTNELPFLIVPVGQSVKLAAYAKLAVLNGYSGVYAYLGQYFDQAYALDTNGVVTTNTTGVLSPYGDYFATQAGAAALVTMPDLDTGERGTDVVYSVSLNVDKNHDGLMDLSFNGADATSQNSPFVFWCNNNFDRWLYDADDATNYMDDAPRDSYASIGAAGQPIPDCNYVSYQFNPLGGRAIPTTRDLEDYARLWVCGITTNLLAALPMGSTITLSWGDVGNPNPGNPTIDLFTSVEADGGVGYLTNSDLASIQVQQSQGQYNNDYVGRLGPGQSLQLNASQFYGWAGDHYIWCGVSNGTGGLTLTVADANSNVLAQTKAFIQIMDIKQMYERWTVGDNINVAPTNNAILATEGLPVGAPAFQYLTSTDTDAPYILFVHGWNMESWDKDRFAETAYKRLYWQGYQGRFGSFRWPTGNGFAGWTSVVTDPDNFDNSEFQAWKSGSGLLNKLTDLNAKYPGNVYLMAHSMGNIVAGEALRLAGNNQVVNTYVAMQGAVAAHAYDPAAANRFLGPSGSLDSGTPDRYAQYYTNGAPCYFNGSSGAGKYVNFFNINDFALSKWQTDQDLKPDAGYEWVYQGINATEYYTYTSLLSGTRSLYFPADTYEIFSYGDEARCYALGAQGNVSGEFKIGSTYQQIELDALPYSFGPQHLYHSLQFRVDYPQTQQFWKQFLQTINLNN